MPKLSVSLFNKSDVAPAVTVSNHTLLPGLGIRCLRAVLQNQEFTKPKLCFLYSLFLPEGFEIPFSYFSMWKIEAFHILLC